MLKSIIISIYISSSILYFIYNFWCYKKKEVVYFISGIRISGIKRKNVTVLNDKYYNTQFLFAIFNCLLIIIESILIVPISLSQDSTIHNTVPVLTFVAINYCLKWISLKKKYVKLT